MLAAALFSGAQAPVASSQGCGRLQFFGAAGVRSFFLSSCQLRFPVDTWKTRGLSHVRWLLWMELISLAQFLRALPGDPVNTATRPRTYPLLTSLSSCRKSEQFLTHLITCFRHLLPLWLPTLPRLPAFTWAVHTMSTFLLNPSERGFLILMLPHCFLPQIPSLRAAFTPLSGVTPLTFLMTVSI